MFNAELFINSEIHGIAVSFDLLNVKFHLASPPNVALLYKLGDPQNFKVSLCIEYVTQFDAFSNKSHSQKKSSGNVLPFPVTLSRLDIKSENQINSR